MNCITMWRPDRPFAAGTPRRRNGCDCSNRAK